VELEVVVLVAVVVKNGRHSGNGKHGEGILISGTAATLEQRGSRVFLQVSVGGWKVAGLALYSTSAYY
jgi:hypothetical protein